MVRWIVIPLLFGILHLFAGCGNDGEEPEVCSCQEETCGEGCCNVKVYLNTSCVGNVDTAQVFVNGVVEGDVTTSQPFYSTTTWAVGESCDVIVRNDERNFQTPRLTSTCYGGASIRMPVDCY